MGKGWADIHIGKRRFWTLWFWRFKNLANSSTSQEQSNGNAPRDVLYTALIVFGCQKHSLVGRVYYILTSAWRFRRCSFRLVGQCESLYSVERVTEWLYAFFVCINLINEYLKEDNGAFVSSNNSKP